MNGNNKKQIWKAWLLIMALMPVLLVKSVHCHSHQENTEQTGKENSCGDCGHSGNPCTSCPICHFTLLPFTEATNISLIHIETYYSPEIFIFVQKPCYALAYSHPLRASPQRI